MLPARYLMPYSGSRRDAQGYFLILRYIVDSDGIPMALYHNGHGIFECSKGEMETLEECKGP